MSEHLHPIETTLYERFKLRWLEGHGYTLNDLMSGIDLASTDPSMPIARRLEEWERDAGFNGEVWPCLEEFLETEFRDGPLMRGLCHDESEYAAYLAAYPTRLADSGRAYAVLDADGTLTLFRSDEKYAEGTTCRTRDVLGTERRGITWECTEGPMSGDDPLPGWLSHKQEIRRARVADGQAIKPTNCRNWFRDCNTLESVDLTGLDTSKVTDMRAMFAECSSLETLGLSSFDTSKVTNMDYMFAFCDSLKSLDLSGWDTSSVKSADSMFCGCKWLRSLDLSGLDTSHITDMYGMFEWCESLTSLDLSGWDTSQVIDMRDMFTYCRSLERLDLLNWNTSHVASMLDMFRNCTSLESLDLSGWDTSQVTDMHGMFADCRSLRSLDLSGWDTSHVADMGGMFMWCDSLRSLDLSGWDISHVTNASYIFHGSRFSEPPALPEGSMLEAEWNAGLDRRERDER